MTWIVSHLLVKQKSELENWAPVENIKNIENSFMNALKETGYNDDGKLCAKVFFRKVGSGFLNHYSHRVLHFGDSIQVPIDVDKSSDVWLQLCMNGAGEQRLFYQLP